MEVQDDNITISKDEYCRLVKVDLWMDALEAAGVDNWEGYSFAYELLTKGDGND